MEVSGQLHIKAALFPAKELALNCWVVRVTHLQLE